VALLTTVFVYTSGSSIVLASVIRSVLAQTRWTAIGKEESVASAVDTAVGPLSFANPTA
jgi:hypothetical protein